MANTIKILTMVAIACAILFGGCGDGKVTNPGDSIPIRITEPSDGAILYNVTNITAQTGADFTIDSVQFIIDNVHVGTDASIPFRHYWDIFSYQNNSEHTITAIGYAIDTSYTSGTVTVTISLEQGFRFASAYRPSSGQAFGVATYQNIMFIATGQDGLEIIDIIDKTSPVYISRFESSGQAKKVDVQYPNVFLADFAGGVVRANFTDPDSLIRNGLYNIQVQANDVAVSGNLVFVADQSGFLILDNSVSDSLLSLNRSELFIGSNYVVARRDTAFITNSENLYIIDASIPQAPEIITQYQTPGDAQGVAVVDTFAFIADGGEGVFALSISDPSNPAFLSRYDVGQSIVTAVEAIDSTIFIGTQSGEVIALEFNESDALVSLYTFNITDVSVNHLHYTGPYLFAATSDGVNIIRFIR